MLEPIQAFDFQCSMTFKCRSVSDDFLNSLKELLKAKRINNISMITEAFRTCCTVTIEYADPQAALFILNALIPIRD